VKVCLDAGGRPSSLKTIKSSGYPDYDRKIRSEMNRWRYRPFQVGGEAVPVCSTVTFIYRIH
jgi:TonB family protein